MCNSFSDRIERLKLVLFLGVAFLSLTDRAWTGEKIQISDEADKREMPSKPLKEDPFSRPLELFRSRNDLDSGSFMPVLPPPVHSNRIRKEKADDNNWIFSTPETLDQDAALKEIFKIRDYDPDTRNAKPKGAAERFFEGSSEHDRKSKSLTARQKGPKDDEYDLNDGRLASRRKSFSSTAEEESLESTLPIAELNLKELLHPNHSADYVSRFSLDLNGRLTHASAPNHMSNPTLSGATWTGRTREQELRFQEFEKLLGGRKILTNPLTDPLNMQQDSTRLEINPVIGRRPENYSSDSSETNPSNPFGGLPGQASVSRPQFLDTFHPRALGIPFSSSSATPSVLPPRGTPVIQAKPAVLELPRRAF